MLIYLSISNSVLFVSHERCARLRLGRPDLDMKARSRECTLHTRSLAIYYVLHKVIIDKYYVCIYVKKKIKKR